MSKTYDMPFEAHLRDANEHALAFAGAILGVFWSAATLQLKAADDAWKQLAGPHPAIRGVHLSAGGGHEVIDVTFRRR